jgi:hypothetical protein
LNALAFDIGVSQSGFDGERHDLDGLSEVRTLPQRCLILRREKVRREFFNHSGARSGAFSPVGSQRDKFSVWLPVERLALEIVAGT